MSEAYIPESTDQQGRAADGGIVPACALTGGQFIDLIGDGQVGGDLHVKMTDLAATMQDVHRQTGKQVKGKVTVVLDLSLEDGAFRIGHAINVKSPEVPTPKAIMWVDEHNRFTRFPPGQGQMFSARAIGGGGAIRSID